MTIQSPHLYNMKVPNNIVQTHTSKCGGYIRVHENIYSDFNNAKKNRRNDLQDLE